MYWMELDRAGYKPFKKVGRDATSTLTPLSLSVSLFMHSMHLHNFLDTGFLILTLFMKSFEVSFDIFKYEEFIGGMDFM